MSAWIMVDFEPESYYDGFCAGSTCWHCKECRWEGTMHNAHCSVGDRLPATLVDRDERGYCWLKPKK